MSTEAKAAPAVRLINVVGQRIDAYLMARLMGIPKNRIYRILHSGEVRNQQRARGGRVRPGRALPVGVVRGDTLR